MRETKEKEIDGLTFHVTQLDAKRAQRLMWRLAGLLSPALGKAISGVGTGGNLAMADLDLAKLGEAIPALFDRLTADQLEELQKELLATCFVTKDGKQQQLLPVWDLVMPTPFTGLKLTLFALEVNFGNFLGGLGEKLGQFARGLGQQSTSPSISSGNGTSGARLSSV